MTHIESTLPEIVGSEVVGLSLRDADGLAAAALYDLVRKATGCRLPQPDGTPSSEVEELLALCSAVLRRHWQTPLTMLDGLSLQDLVSRLMADRMEGNATLGIPAVNGSVTEALSALLERKITGAPEVADGMSLVRLFCDSAASASLTTLTDTTTGWTMDKDTIETLIESSPNVKKINIGCLEWNYGSMKFDIGDGEVIFTNMKRMTLTDNFGITVYAKRVSFPELIYWNAGSIKFTHCPDEWLMPNVSEIICISALFQHDEGTNVTKMQFGSLINNFRLGWNNDILPNLIHLEFGQGTNANLNLQDWSPTTALSSNLLQFLSNFREFLFLRLADRTGQTALTLTLSSAVYTALTTETRTLAELGVTELTELEISAGITLDTPYNEWLDTYRAAINWTIAS